MQNGNIYNKYMMSVSRETQHALPHSIRRVCEERNTSAVQRIFFRLLFIFPKFSLFRFFAVLHFSSSLPLWTCGILVKDLCMWWVAEVKSNSSSSEKTAVIWKLNRSHFLHFAFFASSLLCCLRNDEFTKTAFVWLWFTHLIMKELWIHCSCLSSL